LVVSRPARRLVAMWMCLALLAAPGALLAASDKSEVSFVLRGKPQILRLYGPREGQPVVVSSGDGGWIHLGPHVAEVLAARGFFVVGFDSRAYLASFTGREGALSEADVAGDYRAVAEFAGRASGMRPILVGVSEGAGLSVLAAGAANAKESVQGVVAIGLPEKNELGWRWLDAAIYLTHGIPHEPLFEASAVVGRVSPLPLAVIHSTRDEFVPAAVQRSVFERAREPKRVWTITACNHRFSDNLPGFDAALLEAMAWTAGQGR
jgi:fermentation-respiration switch protein FrsA (DUF1100 family)